MTYKKVYRTDNHLILQTTLREEKMVEKQILSYQQLDLYTSEKYMPLDNFRPQVQKPNLKSCLIWFIAFIIIIALIVGISVIFELN